MATADVRNNAQDEIEIRRVRGLWAYARDLGELDVMMTCFHPDATVAVSWFAGPAKEFLAGTKTLLGRLKPQERSKHAIGNWRCEIKGDRAILESEVTLNARDQIEGVLYDYTGFMRFHDQFERRAGIWRIAKWVAIYDMDRMAPVIPGSAPPGFFDPVKFDGPDNSVAFMRLRQAKLGRTMPPGLVIGGSKAEAELKESGREWLAEGAGRRAAE